MYAPIAVKNNILKYKRQTLLVSIFDADLNKNRCVQTLKHLSILGSIKKYSLLSKSLSARIKFVIRCIQFFVLSIDIIKLHGWLLKWKLNPVRD